MEREFKYALTRFCLRSGVLNLPGSMLELFPESESVPIKESETGEVITVTRKGRQLEGLSAYLEAKGLEVNDELRFTLSEDGAYALRAVQHPRTPDYRNPKVLQAWLDGLFEQDTPMSEAEIRSFYEDIPPDVDLGAALGADNRFVHTQGRWQVVKLPSKREPVFKEAEAVAIQAAEPPQASPEPEPRVVSYSRVEAFSAPPGLNSASEPADLSKQHRVKDILRGLGFTVDSLAAGQLRLKADLGRSHYSAYMQVLPEGRQLDWDTLMSRRRETGSTYAGVIGDHRDLLRLGAPAGMARATLWAWAGFRRLEDLRAVMPLSPFDLESHFQRDGLFDHGLERLERFVAKRVAERGAFSSVLSQLARMKAPTFFVVDQVVDESAPRDAALKVLSLLEQAPFHLVSRIDSGEYCLRYPVAQALEQYSDYATSLRARLPNRKRVGLSSSAVQILDEPDEGNRVERAETTNA